MGFVYRLIGATTPLPLSLQVKADGRRPARSRKERDMSDELFDRDYQATRAGVNDGIDRLFLKIGRSIAMAFRVLNRRQWNAPWRQPTTCR